MAAAGDQVFLAAPPCCANADELWVSDGTPIGTRRVVPRTTVWRPHGFAALGDVVLFAGSGDNGFELWRSDGTVTGTYEVKDIVPGTLASNPDHLTALEDCVLFEAGRQLWRTDGTVAGTQPVMAFPGAPLSEFARIGHRRIVFNAEMSSGPESWVSDGTALGKFRFGAFSPLYSSWTPEDFLLSNGRALFAADDGETGRELWAWDAGATAQTIGVGCSAAGRQPTLESEDPQLGTTVMLRGADAIGTIGVVLVGAVRPPTPLAGSCALYPASATAVTLASFDPSPGAWNVPVSLPPAPQLARVRAALQAFAGPATGALGADGTSAVIWTLGQ